MVLTIFKLGPEMSELWLHMITLKSDVSVTELNKSYDNFDAFTRLPITDLQKLSLRRI